MQTTQKFIPLVSVIGAATLVGACALGGGSSSTAPGGTVVISAFKSGTGSTVYAGAQAFFVAKLDTSNGAVLTDYEQSAIPNLDRNSCEVIPTDVEPKETPMPIGLDVGDNVVLDNGVASEKITLERGFGEGSYATSESIDAGLDKRYSVTLEGTSELPGETWTNELHVPAMLNLDGLNQGTLELDAASGTEITWQSVGADAVVMTFSGDRVGRCVADDDGSFTLPNEFVEDLGPSGYFTVSAIEESKHTLNGRTVLLQGATGRTGNFTAEGGPGPGPDATNCIVAWVSQSLTPGKLDAYIADVPAAQWTSGTKTYGGDVVGILLYGYDPNASTVVDQATAQSGTFSIDVAGMETDDAVSFTDNSTQNYASQAGATVSGGVGSFDGVLTAPDATEVVAGTGTISVTYNSTTLNIGGDLSYAQCYDANASFAPMSPVQRVQHLLGR